jgi:branched-chain amino acid aminotransferase
MGLACLDGRVGDSADTLIPVTDEGLLRGDGVFEVVRLYGGTPFALDEHLDRMAGSAAGLRLPLDLDAVRADVGALLAAAGDAGDAKVRIVITRGGRRIVLLEPLPAPLGTGTLACVEYAPVRLLDGVKSLSYAANMLATRIAAERGFDEALLCTPHGRVLEGPTSSFFCVLDGELCTPPVTDHVLDSITRRRVLDVAAVRERPIARDDLGAASEAFLASTTREVLPVRAIDDQAFDDAPGPVTRAVAAALRERIEAELAGARQRR